MKENNTQRAKSIGQRAKSKGQRDSNTSSSALSPKPSALSPSPLALSSIPRTVIKVHKLGKRYRIGAKQGEVRNIREAVLDIIKAPVRNLQRLRKLTNFNDTKGQVVLQQPSTLSPKPSALSPSPLALSPSQSPQGDDTIWALKDVSFEVKQGEVVGIIGRNGAGKSTLLKILTRITEPTEGYAEIRGRVSSLLEVGTGFHPELTGRENVYLNGAILGMRKWEINKKFDEIVDFSEVEKFLDTPVKRYSSGMKVRLAFAVAAHLEPEILLVDEVLAVGDVAFQKKCLGKMSDVAKQGRTVLFVSHNMGAIGSLCKRALLLSSSSIIANGETHDVISEYLESVSDHSTGCYIADRDSDKLFQILEVLACDSSGEIAARFDISVPITLRIKYVVKKILVGSAVSLTIIREGVVLCKSFDTDQLDDFLHLRKPGIYSTKITISPMFLKPGRYSINVDTGIVKQRRLDYIENAISFEVVTNSTEDTYKGFANGREGLVIAPTRWMML